jgi:hypothetical protein
VRYDDGLGGPSEFSRTLLETLALPPANRPLTEFTSRSESSIRQSIARIG